MKWQGNQPKPEARLPLWRWGLDLMPMWVGKWFWRLEGNREFKPRLLGAAEIPDGFYPLQKESRSNRDRSCVKIDNPARPECSAKKKFILLTYNQKPTFLWVWAQILHCLCDLKVRRPSKQPKWAKLIFSRCIWQKQLPVTQAAVHTHSSTLQDSHKAFLPFVSTLFPCQQSYLTATQSRSTKQRHKLT